MMASVVMADDGIAFDGVMAEKGPLGGAETAFVALAEALAARGHSVEARSNCVAPVQLKGVSWAPLASGVPASCDLYIGNRGYRVIGLSRPRRRLFWLHNPARYLRKPRFAARLALYRPMLITTGEYHASTIPAWLVAGRREIIPYGVLDIFRHAEETRSAGALRDLHLEPAARLLDWLLSIYWVARIRRQCTRAELHDLCRVRRSMAALRPSTRGKWRVSSIGLKR